MKNSKLTKWACLLLTTFSLGGCINDADVLPENTKFVDTGEGNMRFTFVVPNNSGTTKGETTESSGIYETGDPNEYNVRSVTVYLFNSATKNFVKSFPLNNITRVSGTPQVGGGSSSGNQGEHIVEYATNRVLVDPGTYDVFAIANGNASGPFTTENEFINLIDKSTYTNGLITLPKDGALLMSNRGDNSGLYDGSVSSNLKISVFEKLPTEEPEIVTINLERVMAKVLIGQSKESFDLSVNSQSYATIKLEGFQYINLSTQFYMHRHTAVLNDFREPASYTIANGNFGEVNSNNGYVIDPYFFKKKVDGIADFDNKDGYYAYPLKNLENNWQSMPAQNEFSYFYCLENCMYKTAQFNGYSTGVRFKASVTPVAVYDEQKQITTSRPTVVYYSNYKFYTSIEALKAGGANIPGITEDSTDKELAKFFVKRFYKDPEQSYYYCYYNYWIRHLDNKNENEMGVMEFAIVRNNIYRLRVTSIAGLGAGTPQVDPETPDEKEAYLKMDLLVLPWIVRNQGGDEGATLK